MPEDTRSFRDQVHEALQGLPSLKGGLSPDADALAQISGSGSNFIYRVKALAFGGAPKELCLRVPNLNLGSIASEVEAIRAAYKHGVPVAELLGVVSLDGSKSESLFMEWIGGETKGDRIAAAAELAGIRDSGLLGRQCGEALARIHAIDVKSLEHVHREAVGAQATLQSFRKRCKALPLRPVVDFALKWLETHLPNDAQEPPALVHGDYRNGNIVVSAETGLAAVLDWELVHIGNRYEDVGWICTPSWRFGKWDLPVGGFASMDSFCEGYEGVTGRPLDRAMVSWWTLFGQVKWAVICLEMGLYFNHNTASLEHSVIGRRTSEAEMDCLMFIAEGLGGVNTILEDKSGLDAPEPALEDGMFPASFSMVDSVRAFLKDQAGPALARAGDKRNAFVAHVAVNALGMVARGLQSGAHMQQEELASLRRLLEVEGGALQPLREQLVSRLRDGAISLDKPGLLAHLLRFTALQLSIDQPKYPSLKLARSML